MYNVRKCVQQQHKYAEQIHLTLKSLYVCAMLQKERRLACASRHSKAGCLNTCNHTAKLWHLSLGQNVAVTGLGLWSCGLRRRKAER